MRGTNDGHEDLQLARILSQTSSGVSQGIVVPINVWLCDLISSKGARISAWLR